MPLRAGIDVTAWSNTRGDGRFVRNAVGALVALHPEVEWTLYADSPSAGEIEAPDGARIHAVPQRTRSTQALGTGSARSVTDLARLTLAVRRRDLDVFLSPSVYNYFPVVGVPAVVGLHDATAVTHARMVLPQRRDRALWRAKQWLALRRAERLFTCSVASRDAISSALRVPASEIAVVPEAPEAVFSPRPRDATEEALAELGLLREEGYFIFAAGMSPHKGLDGLLEAYASLHGSLATPPLLVVGATEGPYASAAGEIGERVRALGLGQSVRFPGFLDDETLARLYSGATAAVVPSLSEGFGLSAVEAAACGAPVLLSDIGAHRETLGGSGLLFPPGDAVALRERLESVLADPDQARAVGERCRTAVARLSWDRTAASLYELLSSAAS
jgi:glycosyltransferase involved in cell wall biosynthesis